MTKYVTLFCCTFLLGFESFGKEIDPEDLPLATLSAPEPVTPMPLDEVQKVGELRLSLIAAPSGFFPKRVFGRKNIPLRLYITNVGREESCFIMHMGSAAQKRGEFGRAPSSIGSVQRSVVIGRVEEVSFIPRAAGSYSFGCPIQGISGELVIRE